MTYRACEVTGKRAPEKPFRRASGVFKPLRGHNNNSRWRLASYTNQSSLSLDASNILKIWTSPGATI